MASILEGKKALIVDDDIVHRKLVADILINHAMSIEVACNGQEAFDKISQDGAPDVVILDMVMPVMNGWETARRLRSDGFESLPIVALSSVAGEFDKEKATYSGVNVYLEKPVNTKDLISTIEQQLNSN